jgi:hypothetical protein
MTAEEARAMWRALIDAYGETITLQRVSPAMSASVRGRVTGFAPEELVGGINQGSRLVRILAEDVEASGFATPIKARSTDRIIANSKTLMIENVDTDTARIGGTLIAYLITATGG